MLGTLACTSASLGFLLLLAGETRDAVLAPVFVLGEVSTFLAIVVALPVVVAALAKSRFVDARIAAVGLALAVLPWVLTFIITA
jgi:hypothetical protein